MLSYRISNTRHSTSFNSKPTLCGKLSSVYSSFKDWVGKWSLLLILDTIILGMVLSITYVLYKSSLDRETWEAQRFDREMAALDKAKQWSDKYGIKAKFVPNDYMIDVIPINGTTPFVLNCLGSTCRLAK